MSGEPTGAFRERLEDAVDAVLLLADACSAAAVPAGISKRYAAATLSSVKAQLRGQLTWHDYLAVRFREVALLAERSRRDNSEEPVKLALVRLGDTLLDRTRDRALDETAQGSALWCAERILKGLRLPPHVRNRLANARQSHTAGDGDVQLIAGGSPAVFEALLERAKKVQYPLGMVELAELTSSRAESGPPTAVSDYLMAGSEARHDDDEPSIDYDKSDRNVRLSFITAQGFRGIAEPRTLDLVLRESAASALIYGDNGVGKSSFVDAAEFALQGRVGRTSNFNSSLLPLLESLSAEGATVARVGLSDGTEVVRTLASSGTGRLVGEGEPIRPGFRLAPIALKRSDILRFLDTDSLSRGTVFFDYFPRESGGMALRPDDELAALGEEQYELRIRRSALARQLAGYLEADEAVLAESDGFQVAVRDELLRGERVQDAISSGVWDSVDPDVQALVVDLRAVHSRLRLIKKRLERGVEILNPKAYEAQATRIRAILTAVGEDLTDAFLAVTGAPHVKTIRVLVGESGPVSLDVIVELSNGRTCFPQQVFSEGWRDLLALLFFMSMARQAAERGQARIMILDDVFQSVDAGIRVQVMDYVLKHFADWQLIITLHDRLWFEQLRGAFRRHSHLFVEHRVLKWSFEGGPSTAGVDGDPTAPVLRALDHGDAGGVCASAGVLLEQVASELSWRLQTSVQRQRDDKYTLAHLWPGVAKALRRTDLAPFVEDVDRRADLRNLAGAHYNEWASNLPWSDAEAFGKSTVKLFRRVFCVQCGTFIEPDGRSAFACRCGTVEAEVAKK